MATNVTLISSTLGAIEYLVTVDAAGGTVQQNVIADLVAQLRTAGPLYALLHNSGTPFAAQANARAAVRGSCRITTEVRGATIGAGPAAAFARPFVEQNIVGGAADNFSLDLGALKTHGNNTITYVCRLEYRHSVEA